MRAAYIEGHGGTEALLLGTFADPIPQSGEVKIRLKACALNRLDIYLREGIRGTRRNTSEPLILGSDGAGIIEELGPEVKRHKPGDRVVINPVITCGTCQFCLKGNDELCPTKSILGSLRHGCYAEFVTVPEANAVPIPENLSFEEAASIPTAFMPVWRIVVTQGNLQPSETALVLSASSGVGTAAIQICKGVIGARVIATTSSESKGAMAKSIGADDVINYTNEDITSRVAELTNGKGVNLVVDHVGSDFWAAASESLAEGGRYGVCGITTGYKAELHMGKLFVNQLTFFGVKMGSKSDLRSVVKARTEGLFKGIISECLPLEDVTRAHEMMADRQFFGKIILTI